ncbi:hypothetical protein D3C78_970120 [compost metagenome]
MGDRGRDHQQQTGSGGQRGSQTTSSDQRDHPARQVGDFRVGQHDDVVIHVQLGGGRTRRVSHLTLAIHALAFVEGRLADERCARAVLDLAVAVLVQPGDQTGIFPGLEPARHFGVAHPRNALQQVGSGEGRHGRSGGVEDGNEQQGPGSGAARSMHGRGGEEADDHVRQTGGTDHQRHGDEEHVDHRTAAVGVGAEAQLLTQTVQAVQHVGVATGNGAAQTQLRDRVAGELHGQEDRRNHVGEDHHAVLRHLGVGDALHAAEHGVEEHQRHADDHAGVDIHFQVAGEHDADTAHLACHIGEGNEDHADYRHQTCSGRVVAGTDEVRHGELAELAQVGRQAHRQQHVTAGPTHQVDAAVEADEGDDPRHGDEGGRRHPVGTGGHAVQHRVNPLAGDIVFTGGAGASEERDGDVQREGRADDEVDQGLRIHAHRLTLRGNRACDRADSSSIHRR